jgi:hypothetical protein
MGKLPFGELDLDLFVDRVYAPTLRWEDGLDTPERHRYFGTALTPQGEPERSWGTWWMGRAFDRIVEAARG